MKSFFSIFFTLFLLVFLTKNLYSQQDTINPNGYNVFYYPNGFKLSEGNMVNGKPDGYWTTYYVNGQKKSEGNRKNFLLDSLWIFYAENGDTTETIYYVQGKKNGFHKKYYTRLDSGINTVKSKELYVNDKRQGFSYYYYTNGKIHYKIEYEDNYKHGKGYEYNRSGRLIAIEEYRYNNLVSRRAVNRYDKDGEKTGAWVEVFDNGNIKSEINFVDNIPNGTYKEFSPTGKIIKVEKYQKGKKVSEIKDPTPHDTLELQELRVEKDFYPNGQLMYEKTYRDSIPYGTHIFYKKNGDIKKAKIYNQFGLKTGEGIIDTNLNKIGKWTFYHNNGKKYSTGSFKDNKKTGEWIYYYKNGNIRQKGNFLNGLPEDIWAWYYQNGNLLRKEKYFDGYLSGLAFELSLKGDTIMKGKYSDNYKHGKWFYQIGDEYKTGEYYYGNKTKEWVTYYFPEMKLKNKINYINGKKNGDFTAYYLSKRLKVKGQYENNKKNGKWIFYKKDGHIEYTAEYINGELYKVNGLKIN